MTLYRLLRSISVLLFLGGLAALAQPASKTGIRWFDFRAWNVSIQLHHQGTATSDRLPKNDPCVLSYSYAKTVDTQATITGILDDFERFQEAEEGNQNSGLWRSDRCQANGSTGSSIVVKARIKPDEICQNPSYSTVISGGGQDPEPCQVELEIDLAKKTYSLVVPQVTIPATGTYQGRTSHAIPNANGYIGPHYSIENQPLPGGAVLQGSKSFSAPEDGDGTGQVTVTWRLSPLGPSNTELEVEPAGFEDWLPKGGVDESVVGNQLPVKARLKTKDGKPLPQKAVRITFDLVETSRMKGVCNNSPQSADPDFDLQFDEDPNHKALNLTVSQEGQRAETKRDEFVEATAVISSYDFGGYSRLKVTAEMQDGTYLTGYLKGDRTQTEIRIPKRAKDSLIADAWKRAEGVLSLVDNDDGETSPRGDGHPGDGLTLYEEYRGFREEGEHIFGKPKRKDLFIVDKLGGPTKDGIALLQGVTGLEVHSRLLPEKEADEAGVINGNFGAAPHRTKVWAVVIKADTRISDFSYGFGGTGTPKQVLVNQAQAAHPTIWAPSQGKRVWTKSYAQLIAHEILHCIEVKHHGDSDPGPVLWSLGLDKEGKASVLETTRSRGVDGVAMDVVTPIKVYYENGKESSPTKRVYPELPAKYWVAASQGGEHSGMEDCIMRYARADAYMDPVNKNVRYLVEEEQIGIQLCGDSIGTGVNARNRKPRPRYGAATRGKCQEQFCVNDAIIHPPIATK